MNCRYREIHVNCFLLFLRINWWISKALHFKTFTRALLSYSLNTNSTQTTIFKLGYTMSRYKIQGYIRIIFRRQPIELENIHEIIILAMNVSAHSEFLALQNRCYLHASHMKINMLNILTVTSLYKATCILLRPCAETNLGNVDVD